VAERLRPRGQFQFGWVMRVLSLVFLLLLSNSAFADLRITRDYGGYLEDYKAKYAKLRDKNERIVIDGICNSACTIVLGIVPLERVCVTPRASLGFHLAYFDRRWTAGLKVTSVSGTAELMAFYPLPLKDWIARNGGLAARMKHLRNGADLWSVIDPCPDEF
jgi:hypothetical protein